MMLTDILKLIQKKSITDYTVASTDEATIVEVKDITITITDKGITIKRDGFESFSPNSCNNITLKNLNYWLEPKWEEPRVFFINDEKQTVKSLWDKDEIIHDYIFSALDEHIREKLTPLFAGVGEELDTSFITEDIVDKLVEQVNNGLSEIPVLGLSFRL